MQKSSTNKPYLNKGVDGKGNKVIIMSDDIYEKFMDELQYILNSCEQSISRCEDQKQKSELVTVFRNQFQVISAIKRMEENGK